MPTFSSQQEPNLVVANRRLHLEVSEARAAEAEWRNRCSIAEAQLRRVRRALIEQGDAEKAKELLSGVTA